MAEKTKVVEVLPYNPVWKTEFNRIKEQLLTYVGDLIITVEHVGSTMSIREIWGLKDARLSGEVRMTDL